ncbi:MAG: hypothetical protein ACOCSR_02670, partial [Wenzhouxiangella sp.]
REDTLYRTGRERFTFLLPATDAEGARMLRHRFVPDLESLGLGDSADALGVQARFSVQEPSLDPPADAARILTAGQAELHEALHDEPARDAPAPRQDESNLGIDRALELITRGERETVLRHLPEIRQRLQPLIELIEQAQTREAKSEDNVWRID